MAFKLKIPTVLKLVEDEKSKEKNDTSKAKETTTYMRNEDGTSTQVNVRDTSNVKGDTEAKKIQVMRTRIKTDPRLKDYKIYRDPSTKELRYVKR